MLVMLRSAVLLLLVAQPASALDKIEAIGAEKCGGETKSYSVEFLAPDKGVIATPKVVLKGDRPAEDAFLTLTLDGRPCPDARCTIQASKGQEHRLLATRASARGKLCVVIARP